MNILFNLIVTLLTFYSYAIIVYILLSWFPGARESGFGQFLAKICDPYLEPFRKIIPPLGMIDISPIVAILALKFAQSGVAALFRMIG
ncbi:YggT family protein [Metabacillus bambusae]|jgi:YggT family protein|uniref:YggT family protein n=1 Tax=Metabacillus bambusae TaxID=2795218 RepID=A0ABS3MWU6_9BACI|nr:YggT family protein [Metabacillus bambusae]MBO1510497.1 YggT family protein [Metabacillus bambusae]